MSEIVLRPDQLTLKNGVYTHWDAGIRNVLAVLPTGGGKSIVFSDIVREKNTIGSVQCVMAHRTELVEQMSLHIARRGVKHRILAPKNVIRQVINAHRKEFNGYNFVNPTAICAVGGVDTILARQDELGEWCSQVNHWVIDEAHHVLLENKWGKVVGLFPNALGLGVTATPQRADGCGLGVHADGVFDAMVVGPSMRDMITAGSLCDYEIAVPESDFQIDENVAPSGDFSKNKMREASKKSHITGDVVKEYISRVNGKRAIVFATDVATSTDMARNFNEAGIKAASVSAKTNGEVRADYIRRFRDGRLQVLVNVDLFGEGFDVPAVEVVIMARPTASLSVYLQQFGRVLRVMEGKPFGLVIDHVSNWKRHGFPDKPRLWSLDKREKRSKKKNDPEVIELTACKECSKPYERIFPACPHCGCVPEINKTGSRSIEQIDGDLMLLDRTTLANMRAATELEAPADIAARVGNAAGDFAGRGAMNRQIERIETQQTLRDNIAQWAGIQRHLGRDDQQSYRRFYLTAGVDVLTALSLPKVEMQKLNEMIEGWLTQ